MSRDVVVASIQVDLENEVLAQFQKDLLARVHETGSRAVILDVSGLETLDAFEFAALRRIIVVLEIMGSESVLVGLQPGVVSALIEIDANVDGLKTAIDMDAAFLLLEPDPEAELEPEPDDEAFALLAESPDEISHPDADDMVEDER